ncbi:MAG: DUF5132 domain-containing protein [Methylocystis sp.]
MHKPVDESHANLEEEFDTAPEHEAEEELSREETDLVATVATVGVVGVGVAVLEAALLPGVALGVVAMLAPKFVPKIGEAIGPMFKETVRGAYKLGQRTKEFVAEANEHVQDIVAEVDAEAKSKAGEPAKDTTPSA